MRIISGSHKGRKIIAPKGLPVRPTTDFAKEGLFNILNNRISFYDISALELFAGTGNISFELASRGTKKILAVDGHYGCVNFIKKTAKTFEFPITSLKADVFKYITTNKGVYDLIFADPPYAFSTKQLEDLINSLIINDWLNNKGVLIIEHTKDIDLSHNSYFQESRKYGGSVFSFFSK